MQTTQALDFTYGAGAMNLDQTYDQYINGQTDIAGSNGGLVTDLTGWDFATVDENGHVDIVLDAIMQGGSNFTVTLAWFRDRSYNGVGDFTDNAFANLDLEVWDGDFTTLYSESNSLYNSVEHLSFILPTDGKYSIRIVHSGNHFGGVDSVDFAVAWSGLALSAIPEPGTFLLFGVAVVTMMPRRKRI